MRGGPWGAPDPPSCKSFLSHRVKHDMEVDITIFDMVWPPPPLLKNPGYTPEVVRSCEFKGVVRYSISLNRHFSSFIPNSHLPPSSFLPLGTRFNNLNNTLDWNSAIAGKKCFDLLMADTDFFPSLSFVLLNFRSGEEGHYPELIKFTEERLQKVNPKRWV